MHRHSPLLFGSLLALLAASPILAQQQQQPGGGGIGAECRQEIVKLCGEDRAQRRACLTEKASQLSEGCKAEIRQRMAGRRGMRPQGGAAPAPAPTPTPTPED